MGRFLSILALSATFLPIGAAHADMPMPPIQQVSARMAETRARHASQIRSYTVLRRYTLTTGHHSAEMTVRVTYNWPGEKKFEVVSERGSGTIQKRVFHRLLKAEKDATHHDARITAKNYDFQLEGMDTVDGRRCYVLRLTPKNDGKYLIRGRAWVDATDFAVVRVEGEPADTGSFWISSTHIVQRYRKVDGFWMPSDSDSESEVRLFGRAHLRIESGNYKIVPAQTEDEADLLSQPPLE